MNLSIPPTRRGYSIEGVLYEHLDNGQERPLADLPPREIPALAGSPDDYVRLLECLDFWVRLERRHAGGTIDVYLPF